MPSLWNTNGQVNGEANGEANGLREQFMFQFGRVIFADADVDTLTRSHLTEISRPIMLLTPLAAADSRHPYKTTKEGNLHCVTTILARTVGRQNAPAHGPGETAQEPQELGHCQKTH